MSVTVRATFGQWSATCGSLGARWTRETTGVNGGIKWACHKLHPKVVVMKLTYTSFTTLRSLAD